jgi:branched-chain amino acid aminotransferase
MEVVERSIDRTEVYLADEAFLCGTGVQIGAIGRVDYRTIGTGRIGEASKRLRDLYYNVVKGRVPKYRHWCHAIYETASGGKTDRHRTPVSVK